MKQIADDNIGRKNYLQAEIPHFALDEVRIFIVTVWQILNLNLHDMPKNDMLSRILDLGCNSNKPLLASISNWEFKDKLELESLCVLLTAAIYLLDNGRNEDYIKQAINSKTHHTEQLINQASAMAGRAIIVNCHFSLPTPSPTQNKMSPIHQLVANNKSNKLRSYKTSSIVNATINSSTNHRHLPSRNDLHQPTSTSTPTADPAVTDLLGTLYQQTNTVGGDNRDSRSTKIDEATHKRPISNLQPRKVPVNVHRRYRSTGSISIPAPQSGSPDNTTTTPAIQACVSDTTNTSHESEANQPATKKARYKSLDSVPQGAVYMQCQCRPGLCKKVTTLWPCTTGSGKGSGKDYERVKQAINFMRQSEQHLEPPDHLGRQRVVLSVSRTPENSGLSYSNGFNKHKKHLRACIRLALDLKASEAVDQDKLPPFFRDFRCVTKTQGSLKERQKQARDNKKQYVQNLENQVGDLENQVENLKKVVENLEKLCGSLTEVKEGEEVGLCDSCICKVKQRFGDITAGRSDQPRQTNSCI